MKTGLTYRRITNKELLMIEKMTEIGFFDDEIIKITGLKSSKIQFHTTKYWNKKAKIINEKIKKQQFINPESKLIVVTSNNKILLKCYKCIKCSVIRNLKEEECKTCKNSQNESTT
jgi:hypothetical protein